MTPARGPYAKTAAVRRGILEAALEVFAERGYRATTMSAVAERAEFSQRGLVHHFPTKEALLAGVLADYDEDVGRRMPRVTGLAAIEALIDVTQRDAAQPVIVELYAILSAEATSPDHPAHAHYRRRYELFRQYLVEQFTIIHDSGLLRTSLDAETVARLFVAVLDGLQAQWLYDRDGIDIAASLRQFLGEFVILQS